MSDSHTTVAHSGFEMTTGAIALAVSRTKRNGGRFLLIIAPSNLQIYTAELPDERWRAEAAAEDRMSDRLIEFATSHEIDYLDLRPRRSVLGLTRDQNNHHWTEEAKLTLKVIGAGVGRTGTTSLQLALQKLLGGRCYHMHEVFPRPDDIPYWYAAALGNMPDWPKFLSEFVAAVDWPASAYWSELADAFPQALIILSTRADGETWWRSASNTIFPATTQAEDSPWRRMIMDMLAARFTLDYNNKSAAIAAYEAHNANVRANAPPGRLLQWQVEDGWGPICDALGLAIPNEPFPHANTSTEFQERIGSDDPAPKP